MVDEALGAESVTVQLMEVQQVLQTKRNSTILDLRAEITNSTRMQFNTLQTLYKEQLDIIADLIHKPDPSSLWKMECKFYPQDNGSVKCSVGDHVILLGDDFPQTSMLVCTPLTRAARLAQVDALQTGRIYAAVGPAGTGKTETISDTYRMLGYNPVVIRCFDTMTTSDVQNALVLARTRHGGPTCPVIFDEWNIVRTEYMLSIIDACKGQTICLTYNSLRSRAAFPEPLQRQLQKQEFLLPEFKTIVQVMLGAEGITDCDNLGGKIWTVVQACKEKCTRQCHYDFGLRFVRSVTRAVGERGRASGYEHESNIVASTLYECLYPSCIPADRQILSTEVELAFGAWKVTAPSSWTCNVGWEATAAMVKSQCQKRHGVAVINCTDVDACLASIDSAMGAVSIIVEADVDGKLQYHEGERGEESPLAVAFKTAMEKTSPVNLVLKMPQGGTAFEPLNSLLDDNKKLELPSGAVLRLTSYMRVLIFQQDCSGWNPAAVSRVGMVAAHVGLHTSHIRDDPAHANEQLAKVPVLLAAAGLAAATKITHSGTTTAIKITHSGDTRRVSVATDLTFASLVHITRNCFARRDGSITFVYTDDEDDLITIGSDLEVIEALRVASMQTKALRIEATWLSGCKAHVACAGHAPDSNTAAMEHPPTVMAAVH
jgi:dynein heavy chain